MKKILKFVTLIAGLRFLVKILSENVDIKVQIEKLRDELATLETEDLESKLKAFFKKYDPNLIYFVVDTFLAMSNKAWKDSLYSSCRVRPLQCTSLICKQRNFELTIQSLNQRTASDFSYLGKKTMISMP